MTAWGWGDAGAHPWFASEDRVSIGSGNVRRTCRAALRARQEHALKAADVLRWKVVTCWSEKIYTRRPLMALKPIPDGYHSVTPYLIIKGAAQAIEFYKKAFGATELMRFPGPNNTIAHAEIKI